MTERALLDRLRPAGRADALAGLLDGRTDPTEATAALGELVAIAEALGRVPAPRMDPDAGARMRRRLVAVATVQAPAAVAAAEPAGGRVVAPTRGLTARRRLATAGVGGMAAVTALTGVAVGASRSLPGDPLYGVKRAAESVQLHLATNPSAKGRRELEFAATRLAELRQVGLRDPHASGLLTTMRAETAAGQSQLASAARGDRSLAPLREFDRFSTTQAVVLQQLEQSAPAALRAPLAAGVTQLRRLVASTGALAHTLVPVSPPSPVPPPTTAHPLLPSSHPPTGTRHTRPPATSGAPTVTLPATPHRSSTAPRTSTHPTRTPSRHPHSLPLPTGLPSTVRSILPTVTVPPVAPGVVSSLLGNLPVLGGHTHKH